MCQGSTPAQNKVVGSSFIPCCNLEGSFNPVTFLRQLMWFFFDFPVYSSILMLLILFENFIYFIVIIGLYSDLHHHPRTLTSTFVYNQLLFFCKNKQTNRNKKILKKINLFFCYSYALGYVNTDWILDNIPEAIPLKKAK